MILIENFDPVPARLRGAFVAVGNFDGVHRGHAHLIERLRSRADEADVPALALTFDPHPVAILRPEAAPVPLTWTERTVQLLLEAGASEVGIFRTGPWLLSLTAREFFDRVIRGQLQARGMVEGPTFGFGRDRGGDAALLASWCADAGLGFEIVTPTEVDGRIVSSSRIRAALAEGKVDVAAELLGRPHRLRGIVVRGEGRGAALGVPTANLEGIDTQVPRDGVYAGRALVPQSGAPPCLAAIHIGPNLTFGARHRSVEAHLIGFQGDLYGRTLELDLTRPIRPSRKFESVEDLVRQVKADIEEIQRDSGRE